MSRERFDDLKEAYALGALSDAERREVEGYITLHPELRQEVEEFSAVANMLALAPAEYEPPPEVRRNLMRIVNAEASSEQAERPSALSRLRGYLSLRTLAPTALAVIAVALLGWNVLLQGEVQNLQGELQERQAFAMQGSGAASETNAEVVRLENGRSIVLAEDMPSPPEGKTMQIWVIQGDTPQPAGTF
ncbi:MAG: anti-sigma factor, partial [Rubrobacteraceae bacterium]